MGTSTVSTSTGHRTKFAQVLLGAALTLMAALSVRSARADVDAKALRAALGRVGRPLASAQRVVGVVQHDFPMLPGTRGLIPLTEHFSGFRVAPQDFDQAADELTGLSLSWSPPRHLLLDKAMQWTRLSDVHQQPNGTGQGVVVGIVDTGVDLTHPDLRNADGTTRIAWLMDLSRTPAGLQPNLESNYACSDKPGFECEILSASDINQMLTDRNFDALPSDEIGHGTHVASLAASNGLSTADARYVGAAPEATLIVVRVTRQNASVDDFDILLATDFIFERAQAMGMPAVINLSLGSDFGPHDGTDTVGKALTEFLDQPGRAIVVAAGNSGNLLAGTGTEYPDPFGVHTDVAVRSPEGVRVPLLAPVPPTRAATTAASLFVWIGFEPGSDLRVGLDRLDGPWVEPIGRGQSTKVKDGDLEVTLLNNAITTDGPLSANTDGAVVLFDGKWDSGKTFVLRLEGEGAANLWVQSEGDLSPEMGSIGAMFPRATAAQTINIPAVQPELIAAGASINRNQWPTRAGSTAHVESRRLSALALLDSVAWFSSAGPTASGGIKPDILAPGAFVAGALSLKADPDLSPFSLFADTSMCGGVTDCAVVDDFHAVTTGTSMSSPIVAGAVALLFQRDPTLTHEQARQLL
ncbi:MAG TPA: S8 family serine peptidase, partial [Polyangiaceae bacterium]|nr:S8 family serine peptidase [Polyangiaceae bacterium]